MLDVDTTIQSIFLRHYDLGELIELQEEKGGYCSKSYSVTLRRSGRTRKLLLRCYNPRITEGEIRFEHALLGHLRSRGFEQAATVINCRNGGTYVRFFSSESPEKPPAYWALFSFLDGKNKYAWTRTDLAGSEFDSAADILAALHTAGKNFVKPPDADRLQPPIMEFLPTFRDTFAGYAKKAGGRRCDRLFLDHFDGIMATIDRCAAARSRFRGMVELPIHCDYHPGNLKYSGGKVVGVFDFDWAKIDYRLFDVALALVYSCSVWTGGAAGTLRVDRVMRFLKTYDTACDRSGGLEPLTKQEKSGLQTMMAAANLFLLNWELTDFYETQDPDVDGHHRYICHNIQLMAWIERHADDIHAAAF